MLDTWRLLASSAILLTGCSVARVATHEPGSAPTAQNNTPVKGMARGGQQPISGGHVYMYAIGTSGYGGASDSLLNSNTGNEDSNHNYYVTTGGNGGFTITASDYACTSGQQVYLYAIGGSPGIGNTANPGAGLMAVLGQCGTGNSFSGLPATVQMDEVTTVATAYALAGFATDATDMSGSNTALAATGMANAALSAFNLANLGTGQALATTPAGSGTVPQSKINTLADILAACVNSTDPTYNGPAGACSTLFSNAKNGSTAPTNTATAAINIAHNPGANVATLWGLSTPTAPFQSSLGSAPNDWTIAIGYTGGGLNEPLGVAVDGLGNVWIAEYLGLPISGPFGTGYTGSVIEVDAKTGGFDSPSGGYTSGGTDNPLALAIDTASNVWVTDSAGDVVLMDSSGNGASGSPYALPPSALSYDFVIPVSIAIDANGNAWVADAEGLLDEVSYSGNTFSSAIQFGCGCGNQFEGTAVDGSNQPWVSSPDENFIFNVATSTPYQDSNFPGPLAADYAGNIWALNYLANVLTVDGSNGYSGGGLSTNGCYFTSGDCGLAIDGNSNVWVANDTGTTVSEFNNSGSPMSGSSGYSLGIGSGTENGIAVDGSGNVWVANSRSAPQLVELVGAAAPVVTPLAAGVANNKLGTLP
jgi:hypothetical protein